MSYDPLIVKRFSTEVNVLAFGADPSGAADSTKAGDEARFYLDGVFRGTATADPENAGPTGLLPLQFVRVSGTGSKAAEIDYYKYEVRPGDTQPMYPE